jgi:hypothetical protein
MVTYVGRAGWRARPPKSVTPLVHSRQRGTAVHYSGSAAETKLDHSLCAGVVRGIQNHHMDTRGWADIAYSFLVCNHGAIFTGRGRGVRTAANGTNEGNGSFHAVCFLGGDRVGRADVTENGLAAIRVAVLDCNSWAGVREVQPHSFFKATACPGDELRRWIAQGMPVAEDDMNTNELDEYLASKRGQARLESAVDHVMSLGLTGDREGAIRSWSLLLEQVTEDQKKIMDHLGIPRE